MKWASVKVGEIATQLRGVSYAKEEARDAPAAKFLPILRANNITDQGLTFNDFVYVPSVRVSEAQRIRKNDIVIAASSGSLDVVGKAAQADRDYEASFGAFCKLVRPSPRVYGRFLGHFFKTQAYRRRISRLAAGANINNLKNEHIDNLEIPLPPIDEQRRIAAILDQAEAVRAKRRQALARLETLTQSLFFNLEKDRPFEFRTIAELLDSKHLVLHKDGNHGSQYPRADDFGEDGVAFLSAKALAPNGEVNPDRVDRLKTKKANQLKIGWIEAGDVLLAHNASVGRVGIYRGQFGRALIGTSLTCFRPDVEKLRSSFLAASLNSRYFQNQLVSNMGQTTRNQVPITAQKRLTIPIAAITIQIVFEQNVRATERLRIESERSQSSMDRLVDSLQSRAFRGEL